MNISQKQFDKIKEEALRFFADNIPGDLTYHTTAHVLDVMSASERIGKIEKLNIAEMLLLKTGALFHDIGFTKAYVNHEDYSCKLANSILEKHGIDDKTLKHICCLINATRIPQDPKDKIGQVLCDADLDYLGRNDFTDLSEKLHQEFNIYRNINTEIEWNKLQLNFFDKHNYFTAYSRKYRQPQKKKNRRLIEQKLAHLMKKS